MHVVPLNRLDRAALNQTEDPTVLIESVIMTFIGQQATTPWLKMTEPLCQMDCICLAKRMTEGLAALRDAPLPYLRGEKRMLGDTAWLSWTFTDRRAEPAARGRGANRNVAMEAFFDAELRRSAQDDLTAELGALQPGPDLDAKVQTLLPRYRASD
jgi:hypothetical protein